MMHSTRSRNILIVVILSFLVLVGVYGVGFSFVRMHAQETSALSQELEQKRRQKKELSAITQLVANTQKERAALDAYIITSSEAIEFIERLESVGDRVGVASEITELTREEGTLSFTINTEGTYDETLLYLRLLEEFPLYITFDQVQMTEQEAGTTKARTKDGTPLWKGIFSGTVRSFLDTSS